MDGPYARVAVPVLLVVGLSYWVFWSEADLYALTKLRPPAFWAGVSIAGLAMLAGAILAARFFMRWLIALPLVLIEDRSARDALRVSAERMGGLTARNLGVLAVCAFGIAALGFITVLLFGGFSNRVLASLPGRLSVTIPSLAGLLALQFLLVEAVEILGAILVGLVISRIARERGLDPSRHSPLDHATRTDIRKVSRRRALARTLVMVVMALAVAASMLSLTLLATIGVAPSVTITAHRGASRAAPENTLAAIRAAIDSGADGAEIDVQLTADDVVVVFHDEDFKRLADDPRRLSELTFDEVRQIDVGSWFGPEFRGERVPTLDEALDEAGDRISLNIELKMSRGRRDPSALVRLVLEAIDRKDARERCVISTLSYPALAEVRRQSPEARVGYIVFEAVGDPTRLDVDFLSVRDAIATDDFIARARRRGRPVHVWSINDPERFATFVHRGVADVLTSDPALMVARRDELAKLSDLERILLWYRRVLSDR